MLRFFRLPALIMLAGWSIFAGGWSLSRFFPEKVLPPVARLNSSRSVTLSAVSYSSAQPRVVRIADASGDLVGFPWNATIRYPVVVDEPGVYRFSLFAQHSSPPPIQWGIDLAEIPGIKKIEYNRGDAGWEWRDVLFSLGRATYTLEISFLNDSIPPEPDRNAFLRFIRIEYVSQGNWLTGWLSQLQAFFLRQGVKKFQFYLGLLFLGLTIFSVYKFSLLNLIVILFLSLVFDFPAEWWGSRTIHLSEWALLLLGLAGLGRGASEGLVFGEGQSTDPASSAGRHSPQTRDIGYKKRCLLHSLKLLIQRYPAIPALAGAIFVSLLIFLCLRSGTVGIKACIRWGEIILAFTASSLLFFILEPAEKRLLHLSLTAITTYLCFIAYFQFFAHPGDYLTVCSTLGHHNNWAGYLLLFLPFFLANSAGRMEKFNTVTFLLGCGALLLSFSRGGWVSFFVAMVIFFGLVAEPNRRRRYLLFLVGGGIIFILLALFLHPSSSERIGHWFAEANVLERLAFWQTWPVCLGRHPLVGLGPDNLSICSTDLIKQGISEASIQGGMINYYLQFLVEYGLLGMAGFLFFLISHLVFLFRVYRHSRPDDFLRTGLTGIIGFLLINNFERLLSVHRLAILWALVFGAVTGWAVRKAND